MRDEELADYISKYTEVEYKVIDNIGPEGCRAQISLKNTGSKCINQLGWQIYFYHFAFVEPRSTREHRKATIANPGVVVHHVNGPLFSLEPLPNFVPWDVGSSKVISFHSGGSLIARTDLMPNWYVTIGQTTPKVIECTASENLSFVAPFTSPRQWKRLADDLYNPFTPERRYEHNMVVDEGTSTARLFPTPLQLQPGEGSIALDRATWVIVAPPLLENEAQILSSGTGLRVVQQQPKDKYILMQVKPLTLTGIKVTDETYILDMQGKQQNVFILGHGRAGVFYGVQSFLNMLEGDNVNSATVYDSPRFPYRGFMLDVARNFFDKIVVKKIIDLMAAYKMNVLHLHLADDEGWRLEIPDLPELTEVGGRRGHDPSELQYLMPTLGSGPDPTGLGCGYYSQADYKEILRYAAARHVTVIPEIDVPGHSNAAIKSMRARYHKYHGSDEAKATQYLLHDLQDASQNISVQMFKQNVINPCLESSYFFIDKVLDTLIDYHADIQPLKTFHLGGDEVPPNALKESMACKEYFKTAGKLTMHQLKEMYVKRVMNLAMAKGLKVQAWEDAYYGEDQSLFDLRNLGHFEEGTVISNAWISQWESDKAQRAHQMANKDYKVVLTSATHLYFDHHHEPDPEERGLYWATRYVDVRKVFNFMPDDFWANMDSDGYGHRMDKKTTCEDSSKCLPLEKPENIIGIEGALWGETVRTEEQVYGMIVLRILALAERAWHRASWEAMKDKQRLLHQKLDWTQFANHLGYKELAKLEKEGFAYYLPLPGAMKQDGTWKVNTAIPNHMVQCSVDGGLTWNDVLTGTQLPESGPFKLATRSYDGKRRSRPIDVPPVVTK